MAIERTDTISLMQAMERIKAPEAFLVDTFFPNVPPTALTSKIEVEYRKGGRRLAPYIIPGTKGVNITREGSTISIYQPPMMGPRRTISVEDIEQRGFGESVYSTMSPDERAARMQARDLAELQAMITNRKNKMAADILTTGQTEIKGYADDGNAVVTDVVKFDWTQEAKVATAWSDKSADIYGDIEAASDSIQESTGEVPTVMICGANVAKYLRQNNEVKEWFLSPSFNRLSLMNFEPSIKSTQVIREGMIERLNLEVYSYKATYLDDDGTVKPFIDPDDVIIAIKGRGKQLHGAVTLVNKDGAFETYAGAMVPKYIADANANAVSLTVYSRCLLVPEWVDDWATIHTCTTE